MKEHSSLPSLEKLGEAIERFDEKESVGRPKEKKDSSRVAAGMRMGVELVCGVLVGMGIGLFLDDWLGTSPFLMVICLFFGAAAGFLTLYRTSQALSEATDETTNKVTGKTAGEGDEKT